MKLNEGQESAVKSLLQFLNNEDEQFFLLEGSAGTGKTTTIKEFANATRKRLVFTAPTNKATKVLRETFSKDKIIGNYEPECKTIYSLLKLRMEANGEIKELSKGMGDIDLSRYGAIIVDEGSMIGGYLWEKIKLHCHKVILMADWAQLPPVRSKSDEGYSDSGLSPIWADVKNTAELSKVMRHDNQILQTAMAIRGQIKSICPRINLKSDYDEKGGVRKVTEREFHKLIEAEIEKGSFSEQSTVKAIAWRNVVVDELNLKIRKRLYDTKDDYLPGDRIILLEPAKDFLEDAIIASTDDEGTIEQTHVDFHPQYPHIKCYRTLVQMDEGYPITLWKLHPDSNMEHKRMIANLANEAKIHRHKWKKYWEFREAFHNFRYGYSITAHRAQGSTYDKVFVNVQDILRNTNRSEAFRCLYVACTRPRKELIIC